MTNDELTKLLQSLGWKTARAGKDRYAIYDLEDRYVEIWYTFRDRADHQRVSFNRYMGINEFAEAIEIIESMPEGNYTFERDRDRMSYLFKEPQIQTKTVVAFCEDCIVWAKTVDIDARYEELCNLDPSTPGAAGSWHLAALAVQKKKEKLTGYLERFENGDRCGFVNYIKQDFIERALELATR